MKGVRGMPVGTVLEREEFSDVLGNDTSNKLEGRIAYCIHCGKLEWSSVQLNGFEYQGIGARSCTQECKCGIHKDGHELRIWHADPRSLVERMGGRQHTFQARGPLDMDIYSCGCHKTKTLPYLGPWKKWKSFEFKPDEQDTPEAIPWNWSRGSLWNYGGGE